VWKDSSGRTCLIKYSKGEARMPKDRPATRNQKEIFRDREGKEKQRERGTAKKKNMHSIALWKV
jgi:hypothetical protein